MMTRESAVDTVKKMYKITPIKSNWSTKTNEDDRNNFDNIFGKVENIIVPEVDVTSSTQGNYFYITGLSTQEKEILEKNMNLKPNTLNPYNKEYWANFRMKIPYSGKIINADIDNNPVGYLTWKLLSVNSQVATSKSDPNLPFANFIMLNEETESKNYNSKYAQKEKAFKRKSEMTIEEQLDFMKVYKGGSMKLSLSYTPDQISALVGKVVDESPDEFLKITESPTYKMFVFIQDCITIGSMRTTGKKYFITGEIDPIGTIEETIDYLKDPLNNGVMVNLKSKIEAIKKTNIKVPKENKDDKNNIKLKED